MRREELADGGAVLVILTDTGGRVVLVQSQDRPEPLFWKFPGGGVEPGETALQAAAREVWEETGIHIDPEELTWLMTQYLDDHDKRTFIAQISPERLAAHARRGNDGEMVGLFKHKELPTMLDFLEEHRRILTRFLARKSQK